MDFYINYQNIENAWIYIAIDIRDLSICKVGLTTNEYPFFRIQQGNTSNPYYALYNVYNLAMIGISRKELGDFERYLHNKLGSRIPIVNTGLASEWLYTSPFYAEKEIEFYISNAFTINELSFQDEDGEVIEAVMLLIKQTHRPHPNVIACRADRHKCIEYIEFLSNYHNV